MPSQRAKPPDVQAMRERAHMMLAAFERAEPSPLWSQFRVIVDQAKALGALTDIVRDLRGASAGLLPDARAELERQLRERLGPDEEWERDRRLVEKVRHRGKIRSEREYRLVQAFADSIAAEDQREYLALGALLDEFMSRGAAT